MTALTFKRTGLRGDVFTGYMGRMFYHTGDIIMSNGGTPASSEEVMIKGSTLIESGGTFIITKDIINLGYLEVLTGTAFTNTDDLILSGKIVLPRLHNTPNILYRCCKERVLNL